MIMNTQNKSPIVATPTRDLELTEIFYTIQGEGPFAGTPAVFIRLAGCNLQCHWCDTEYPTNFSLSVDQIVGEVAKFREDGLVVITGGEPFRQPIIPLIRKLPLHGYKVQIETNGTVPIKPENVYGFATLVVSPKTAKVHRAYDTQMAHWKYVIKAGEVDPYDGLPSGDTQTPGKHAVLARPANDPTIWVSPLDEKDETLNLRNLKAAATSAMANGYRLSLQQHKLIGLP